MLPNRTAMVGGTWLLGALELEHRISKDFKVAIVKKVFKIFSWTMMIKCLLT